MDAVVVGTRKGLFLLDGDAQPREPLLPGWEIHHATVDPRDGALYACANTWTYGPSVHRSRDRGETWERLAPLGLPEESGLTFERVWHVEPGPDGTLWVGGDPGALFRSRDGGESWEAVSGILEHPTRDRWHPGAGGLIVHSIAIDPERPERLAVGISAAGTFRSEDGGETWEAGNAGVRADFLPDPYPEVGQCVHKLLVHPARADRLWQQNHCGVYRSDDFGATWEQVDGNGLPSPFGFGLALDAADPDVAYVIPEIGAENRVVSDGRLGVWRTGDGGASWSLASEGLPDPAWTGVLREGMGYGRDGTVAFGTQSGSVYALRDGTWDELASHLPAVLSVEVAAWSS